MASIKMASEITIDSARNMTLDTPANKSGTIDDSGLKKFMGYNLKRAYMIVQADFMVKLASFDLRAQLFSTLLLIVDNPGASQTAIANSLAIERSAMVLLIDELEKKGLVERRRSPNDRRSYALFATRKGKELCREMQAAVENHEADLLPDLSAEEREFLLSILARIQDFGQGNEEA